MNREIIFEELTDPNECVAGWDKTFRASRVDASDNDPIGLGRTEAEAEDRLREAEVDRFWLSDS
jgi:hypothetical protein